MRHVQQVIVDREGSVVKVVIAGQGALSVPDMGRQIHDIVNTAAELGARLATTFTIEHTEEIH